MKRPAQKVFILAVGVVIMLIAGCQEQMAVENIQLKKEIAKQKELLDKCLRGKKALQEKPQEEGESLIKFLFEENLRLDKENKSLKAQVWQLETRVQQLEKELEELKKPPGPQPLPSTPEPL